MGSERDQLVPTFPETVETVYREGFSDGFSAAKAGAKSAEAVTNLHWKASDAAIYLLAVRGTAAGEPAESLSAEKLAQRFHETYERLAPSFGYETRNESAKPWDAVPEQNRRLMVAVCAELQSSAGGALRGAPPPPEGTNRIVAHILATFKPYLRNDQLEYLAEQLEVLRTPADPPAEPPK